jgi:hypothetical protein
LLIRNLHDVFGENDPVRRRAAIDKIFTEDCVYRFERLVGFSGGVTAESAKFGGGGANFGEGLLQPARAV